MNSHNSNDPYADNVLVKGLGPILSPPDTLLALTYFPNHPPNNIADMPVHIRLHHLMALRDLHIPSQEGARLHQTIDLMIRQSYRYRNPESAETWRAIGGEAGANKLLRAPAGAAMVTGFSGTGKTQAVLRSFATYPTQVIYHERFRHMAAGLHQLVYLSTDVPASGKSGDLAANLMMSFDQAMNSSRFSATLQRKRNDGMKMLDEWKQVASSHFLGILHLDEIQNFFKIPTLERRRAAKNSEQGLELSIVEDSLLKSILNFTNTSQIALLFSGTPDGVGAMTKRVATTQRFVAQGYHAFPQFSGSDDLEFREFFFPALCRYQYVKNPIPHSEDFAKLIIELTAGVPRIIIALWIAAHRVAFGRRNDDLRPEDFKKAANTYLSPLLPAITALQSQDTKLMRHFEDLMPREDGFWSTFWNDVRRT
ncbi:AAA family ATPase [Janthinobacterium sp. SUN176]|uniref:AAA family ATPase n=1 Tax=Janthinobacterium sp. SUN176 TaxID=3014788 RepID=UPI002712ABA5|nr:AAA family ATPase [Janthinobacterium sp. SUN176]MDO8073799.1 AAA family ATPase [Janthinobacterium sp. SUN176]